MSTTLLYYSANLIPETFAVSIRNRIQEQSDRLGMPIISVTHKPIDFGKNICVGELKPCPYNVYKQILIGTRIVDTDTIVCVEDDTLYTDEHLSFIPLNDETFFYNSTRLLVERRRYVKKGNRTLMSQCVVSTKLMLETLERRYEKYPHMDFHAVKWFCEPGRYEFKALKLPQPIREYFTTEFPSLTFSHRNNMGGVRKVFEDDGKFEEIPYWGNARELWEKVYNGKVD
jgi:hypothetical protein